MESAHYESKEVAMSEVADSSEERMEEGWFADRRSSRSIPPPRRTFVPPMGDAEVDVWLR